MTTLSTKNAKVIISGPTPEFPLALRKQFIGQNMQWFAKLNQKDCSYPVEFFNSKKGKYYEIINKLNKVNERHKNLYFFDALNVMCPNSKCDFLLNGKSLYRDDDHLSDYSSRKIIAPNMIRSLITNKIIK